MVKFKTIIIAVVSLGIGFVLGVGTEAFYESQEDEDGGVEVVKR